MEVLKIIADSQVMGAIVVALIVAATVLAIVWRLTRQEDDRIKARRWDGLQSKAIVPVRRDDGE